MADLHEIFVLHRCENEGIIHDVPNGNGRESVKYGVNVLILYPRSIFFIRLTSAPWIHWHGKSFESATEACARATGSR
jgi:hypothetical protein